MKKYFIYSALAAALTLTSCSSEESLNPAADGMSHFTVSLGKAMGTRAFGDATTATNLQIAVYDATNNDLISTQAASFEEGENSTDVSIKLVNGRAYKIAFFASSGTEAYSFDANGKKITVDYTKMASDYNCSDKYDCFYKLHETQTVTGPVTGSVTLTRPMAQINWGTSDLDESIVNTDKNYGTEAANLVSKVTAKQVYSEFDMLEGDVTGEADDVTFPAAARPNGEAFPVEPETYGYLSMQYLLVPSTGTVSDLELEITNGGNSNSATVTKTVAVPAAPVQANYRTNIYGALLTSDGSFTVNKEENFGGNFNPTVITEEELAKGGVFTTITPVEEITIPAELENPVTLNINNSVKKVIITADNSKNVTINVGKDVEWPEIVYEASATFSTRAGEGLPKVEGVTLKGDPTSSKSFSGFSSDIYNKTISSFDNITFDGVVFDGKGINFQYGVGFNNLVVRNCVFNNMTMPAVKTQNNGSNYCGVTKGVVFENNKYTFTGTATNVNGVSIYDTGGEIIVKNNTIENTSYHGVFVYANSGTDQMPSKIEISGNTITGSVKDGIKVQDASKVPNIVVSGNTVKVKENGVRVVSSFDNNVVEISANTIDMANAIAYKDGEPWGVLLKSSSDSQAKVVLKDNIYSNATHTANFVKVTATTGSEINDLVEIDDTYNIAYARQLVALSDIVNALNNLKGKTVKLTADIDMNGVAFRAIAEKAPNLSTSPFCGTFDGDNHSISNLTVVSDQTAGLFGYAHGTIKNVVLKNPSISGTHWVGGIVGYQGSNIGALIDKCKVIGGSITSTVANDDNGDKAGGILGYGCVGADKVTNCTVENVTITAYRDMGGIVGAADNAANVTGNTVSGVTLVYDGSNDYNNIGDNYESNANMNGVIGRIVTSGTQVGVADNNTSSNVTKSKKS